MSLTLYDRAIAEKIKSWVLDTETTVFTVDETREVFKVRADKTNDRPIQLPLITINRARESEILLTANRAMTRAGMTFNSENGISDHLNAVPISITYNINIYCRTLEQADEYVRNFVFNIINYPRIIISIPYNNSNLSYSSFMSIQSTIADNSDIEERLVPGQFSRFTISVVLRDAYFFSYNRRKIPKVVVGEIVVDNNGLGQVDNDKLNLDKEVVILIDNGKGPHRFDSEIIGEQ